MDEKNFEKIKYWVEVGKWFIVSVALVLASSIVSWNFTSRDKSFEEVKFYSDKYLTELIVLNEKIGPRYKLAQFFKNVTVNNDQRKGWERYFNEVKKEYDAILKTDSLKQAERQEILNSKDTSQLTIYEKQKLEYLNSSIEKIKIELNAGLKLPDSKGNIKTQRELLLSAKVYIYSTAELEEKAKKINELLLSYGVASIYQGVPGWKISKNEIVYFNSRQINQCQAIHAVLVQEEIGEFDIRESSVPNDLISYFKIYVTQ